MARLLQMLPRMMAVRQYLPKLGVKHMALTQLRYVHILSSTFRSSKLHELRTTSKVKTTAVEDDFEIKMDGDCLTIVRGSKQMEFHYIWLRDHCRCSACFRSNSLQRLVDPADLEPDISPDRASISENKNNLEINWSDGHEASYSIDWLDEIYKRRRRQRIEDPTRVFCDRETLEATLSADVTFRDYMESDEGVIKLLQNLHTFGIAFMSGVPVTRAVTRVIGERVHSPLKGSLYGGDIDFFPQIADQLGDHSFGNDFLPLHADFPSQYDPPGYIMMHYLKQSELGGESMFSDALRAARILRESHPEHYEALATLPVSFHKIDKGISVRCSTIILDVREANQDPAIIRISNDDRGILDLNVADSRRWYAAWRHLRKLTTDPKNVYVLKCSPGRVVFFDNWRLAHGRLAFKGERVLESFNWSRDLVESKMRTARIMQEEII